MNGPVKKALGLNVTHGSQARIVRARLMTEIMKPVTNIGISQIYQIYVLLKQKYDKESGIT